MYYDEPDLVSPRMLRVKADEVMKFDKIVLYHLVT